MNKNSLRTRFKMHFKILTTDAVANLVEAMSRIVESEGGTKQVEEVMKDAHEVAGVLSGHQSHVAWHFPCCSPRHAHHDHATPTTLHL